MEEFVYDSVIGWHRSIWSSHETPLTYGTSGAGGSNHAHENSGVVLVS